MEQTYLTNSECNNKLYRFDWDYGRSLFGFICNAYSGGWIVINHMDNDLALNGYYLMNRSVIRRISEVEQGGLHSRVLHGSKLTCGEPTIAGAKIDEVISDISRTWKILGIHTKNAGYEELEIGFVRTVGHDFLSYNYVSTEGLVENSSCKLLFDDLLILSFGGRYEVALTAAIT